jgi:hypothetical protein
VRVTNEGLSEAPSEYLQAFLHDSISSYEELEALLVLVRDGQPRSAKEVAQLLKVPADGIAAALTKLACTEGLLQIHDQAGEHRFQYAPRSKLLRQVVEELATAYVEQRLAVVQLMSAYALERMRGAAVRHLADAFRFERRKK